MNDLARINTSTGEIVDGNGVLESFLVGYDQRLRVAGVLLKSGFLPKAYETPEQVLSVMLTAHELNIPPMMALRTIDIIQNQPTLSPELMLALIRRSGQLEDMHIQDDGRTCHVTMKRKGEQAHTESFGMDNAEKMLTSEYRNNQRVTIKLSEKHNWKSMPETMRKWRAVGACARIVFPDVLGGMYLREEVEEIPQTDEVRYEDEPQEARPAPVEVAPGVTLPVFDPRAERISWGKYGPKDGSLGMFWIELDRGYLTWIAGQAKKPEDRQKAAATLQSLDMNQEQVQTAEKAEGDIFGGIFEKSQAHANEIAAHIGGATGEALVSIARVVAEYASRGELTEADAAGLMSMIEAKEKAQ